MTNLAYERRRGSGSGHHGHSGRPGKVGGSSGGGGGGGGGSARRDNRDQAEAAFRQFTGSAKKAPPTQGHRAAMWENMLGTVYTANNKREAKYFDYNYASAIKHIGPHTDVRVYRTRQAFSVGEQTVPSGKLVWWVKYPAGSTGCRNCTDAFADAMPKGRIR